MDHYLPEIAKQEDDRKHRNKHKQHKKLHKHHRPRHNHGHNHLCKSLNSASLIQNHVGIPGCLNNNPDLKMDLLYDIGLKTGRFSSTRKYGT